VTFCTAQTGQNKARGEDTMNYVVPPKCEALIREIHRRRDRFVWPVTAGALTIYLAALITLSYWPSAVGTKVWGSINVAYLIVLVQFVLTFSVALAYTFWARRRIDLLAGDALAALRIANNQPPTDARAA
jgi:uncharacterized membrane protein (DUF485 family)